MPWLWLNISVTFNYLTLSPSNQQSCNRGCGSGLSLNGSDPREKSVSGSDIKKTKFYNYRFLTLGFCCSDQIRIQVYGKIRSEFICELLYLTFYPYLCEQYNTVKFVYLLFIILFLNYCERNVCEQTYGPI